MELTSTAEWKQAIGTLTWTLAIGMYSARAEFLGDYATWSVLVADPTHREIAHGTAATISEAQDEAEVAIRRHNVA